MTDLLARVAAMQAQQQAKSGVGRDEMRKRYPEVSALVDALRGPFGAIHAVVINGNRYGKPEMPFRRDQLHQPPIPGVTGYGSDSEFREGQPRHQSRKDRGVPRAGSDKSDGGAAGARPWWAFDDDGGEKGREV